MASEHNAINDLERLEHRVLPGDPPVSADLLVGEDRLPYDLAGPKLTTALVRLVERFGLPERPVVAVRAEDGEDGDYQVLSGATWIRAAREAGIDRIPVRTLELTDAPAAFLALVLNQARPADEAAQTDALQALLEAGANEQELARITGLGRGRLRRLVGLLELHPVLRQALREGRLGGGVRGGRAVRGLAASLLQGSAGSAEDAAARARRQAEELLRTLEEARITGAIRERITEVIEELNRIALVP